MSSFTMSQFHSKWTFQISLMHYLFFSLLSQLPKKACSTKQFILPYLFFISLHERCFLEKRAERDRAASLLVWVSLWSDGRRDHNSPLTVTLLAYLKYYNFLLELDLNRSKRILIPKTCVSNLGLYIFIDLWPSSFSMCYWESKHLLFTFFFLMFSSLV